MKERERDVLQLAMESEHVCRSSGKSLRFIGHESVNESLCAKLQRKSINTEAIWVAGGNDAAQRR